MPPRQTDEKPQELTAERAEVRRIVSLLKKTPLTLRRYYAVGEQMRRLSEDPDVARRGSGWRDRVAELAGCSASTLTKALQFRLSYEEGDLAGLESLGVGWSRLTIALAVGDREKRHGLLLRAREEGWGEHELQRAVQQLRGSRRGGGRRRREMRSQGALADAAELLRLTELWLEFDEKVWSRLSASDLAGMEPHAVASLVGLLGRAGAGLKRLQIQAGDARRRAESLLRKPGG